MHLASVLWILSCKLFFSLDEWLIENFLCEIVTMLCAMNLSRTIYENGWVIHLSAKLENYSLLPFLLFCQTRFLFFPKSTNPHSQTLKLLPVCINCPFTYFLKLCFLQAINSPIYKSCLDILKRKTISFQIPPHQPCNWHFTRDHGWKFFNNIQRIVSIRTEII